MSTVAQIESAIARLPLGEQREVFAYLSASLETESHETVFPDLKKLLIEFPDVGSDEDFARVREFPSSLDLQ